MSKNCCICGFFKRTFLYQILIATSALKLQNAFRYYKQFTGRIAEVLTLLHLPETLLDYLPKNKEMFYKGFFISLIVIASLSILGCKFFKFLSGLSCILLAYLYHNPTSENKEKKFSFDLNSILENLPNLEFMLYIGIALAMFGNICTGTCKKEKEVEEVKVVPIPNGGNEKVEHKPNQKAENKNKGVNGKKSKKKKE